MSETTEQVEGGGSKAAEKWPVVYVADLNLGYFKDRGWPIEDRIVLLKAQPDDATVPVETYVPVSALLSDEVVEAVAARKLPAGAVEPNALLVKRIRDEVRADLQAAIDQLGGTDAH